MTKPPPPRQRGTVTPDTFADDKLEGVRAIADFLGWPGKPGERRVYQARERGDGFPVRKRRGIGIYAFKSELNAWFKAQEALADDRAA